MSLDDKMAKVQEQLEWKAREASSEGDVERLAFWSGEIDWLKEKRKEFKEVEERFAKTKEEESKELPVDAPPAGGGRGGRGRGGGGDPFDPFPDKVRNPDGSCKYR